MSRYNKNSLWADNDENLDDINKLQMIEAGVTKIIGHLKDDNVYIFNNMRYNFQDNLLEIFLDDENKDNENIAKVLLLTTELQEKYKEIKNTKNTIYGKYEQRLKIRINS